MTKPLPISASAKRLDSMRRIRADECIHGENEIGRVAFGGQALGEFCGAYQAHFFAGGPDEGNVAIFQRSAELPDGADQRGVADAIVEAAAIRARAEQRAVGFRNRNGVAEADAQFGDFRWSARADVHANGICGAGCARIRRPFEIRGVPAVGQFDDGVVIAFCRVDQRRMAREKAQFAAAEPFDFEQAVLGDGFHFEADFVHVGDDEDARSFCVCCGGAEMKNQISGIVGFGLGPRRKQALDDVANRRFVTADTVVRSPEL